MSRADILKYESAVCEEHAGGGEQRRGMGRVVEQALAIGNRGQVSALPHMGLAVTGSRGRGLIRMGPGGVQHLLPMGGALNKHFRA